MAVLVINRSINSHLSHPKAMTYKHFKSFVIVATVLIWARLLFGTVDFLSEQTSDVRNNEVVATEQNTKEIN